MTTNPIPEPSDELVLKPCPFCGGEAYMTALPKEWESDNDGRFLVECLNCGANAPSRGTTEAKAAAAWNARAAIAAMPELSALQEKVRRLEKLVVEMDDHVHDCCGCFATAPDGMLQQMNEVRARTALTDTVGGV